MKTASTNSSAAKVATVTGSHRRTLTGRLVAAGRVRVWSMMMSSMGPSLTKRRTLPSPALFAVARAANCELTVGC